jgi:hypothetical protein
VARQRLLVMACFYNIEEGSPKIRHVLGYCYKHGVLLQLVDKEPEAYLD